MSDKCKHCNKCKNGCDLCSCCGKCQRCGAQYPTPFVVQPVQPVFVPTIWPSNPVVEPWHPDWVTITCGGVTITSPEGMAQS